MACLYKYTYPNFCASCLKLITKNQNSKNSLFWARHASSKTVRKRKRKQRDETVFQYASKNTKRSDRVYVWGYAATGSLGVRNFVEPSKRGSSTRLQQHIPHRLDFWTKNQLKVHDVSCGYGFTVYIASDGKKDVLYGTGINTDTQLGFQPLRPKSAYSADYVIEPSTIQLPLQRQEGTKLKSVACGRAHTVVSTENEGVFTFGHNSYGQCGRTIVEDEEYGNSQIINKIDFPHKIKQLECGQDHTLFVTETGEVYSFGLGSDGQTGLGHFDRTDSPARVCGDIEGEHITSVACTADCVLTVSDKGDLFGWGNNEYNQLAAITKETTQVNVPRHLPFKGVGKVKKVASAGAMCALLNDHGDVYVWGYGILGVGPSVDGSETPRLIPPTLFGRNELNEDSHVVHITSGMNHFAALTSAGELYMWGKNKTGCLGFGHTRDQFFPFKVLVPAECRQIECGVDHTVLLSKGLA